MKSNPYLTDAALNFRLPETEKTSEELWSEFEETGSIRVFLAYAQMTPGFEASRQDSNVLSPR
jgi:hypothetical protein